MRKRILQIVDGYRMGGAENKLMELIASLDKKKYEILLANIGPVGPLKCQFEKLGIKIYDFPRKWRFDPIPLLQLYKLIRYHKIEIVQTTLFWADFIGTLAAKAAGSPLILSWETVSHEGDPYHNNFQRQDGYRLLAKLNHMIVAVSNEVKTSLIRRRGVDPDKIRVIHYGVDLKAFHPNGKEIRTALRSQFNIESNVFLIGIVARLESWKGHKYFIEAFSDIAPRLPNVKTILIGDGSLRPELERLSEEKNLQDCLYFLGIRDDIPALLNCIDLLVLPSLPGEGFPNVLLEAMACGKPVIATKVGGVPELVRNGYNGYIVKAGDVDELKSALLKAVGDDAQIRQMAKNALQTVQKDFSLEKQIKGFEEIYDSYIKHG